MSIITDNLFPARPFFIEFSDTYLHGDVLHKFSAEEDPPSILFLHGDSPSDNRSELLVLRQLLLHYYNVTSCAFDFLGHGCSSGSGKQKSLQQRAEQATDVIDSCFDSQPFSIVAAESGIYTALKLLETAPVENLVLIAPTIHNPETHALNLGEIFGEQQLCASQSPENSDVFYKALQNFQGEICMIAASQNEVISLELTKVSDWANVFSQECHIPDSSRPLMDFDNTKANILINIASIIKNFATERSFIEDDLPKSKCA